MAMTCTGLQSLAISIDAPPLAALHRYLFIFCIAAFFVVYAWNRVYKFLRWLF